MICFAITLNAQAPKVSIIAGLLDASVQQDFLSNGYNTGTGYYLGLGSEFKLTNRSSIYSELSYGNVNASDYFQLPVLYKYRFADQISILIGPQIGYINEERARNVSGFSIGLGAALRYDFTKRFYGIARYTFQLNNHYNGVLNSVDYRIDVAGVGFGFTF